MVPASNVPLFSSTFIILVTIGRLESYLLSSTVPASTSPPSSSISYSLRRIVQLPTVPERATVTIHEARRSSCLVLFAIILPNGILTAILIDIVLVGSYLMSSTPPAFSSPTSSSTSFPSSLTCYRPRRRHAHQHPHWHGTRRVVLYNFPLSLRDLQ